MASLARSVITALARIEGRTVGIIASQPLVDDGAIDESAATKAGRMVELCDAYEYPIVALIDTPGCVIRRPGPEASALLASLTRWHTRPLLAHHHRSVPLFAVQVGRGGGLGPAVLAGLSNGRSVPVAWLAWPTTELDRNDGFAVVRLRRRGGAVGPRRAGGLACRRPVHVAVAGARARLRGGL